MWYGLLDLLFPPQCAACQALGAGLCADCTPRAGALHARSGGLRIRALGPYEGALRAAVLALKDGRRDVAASLGALLVALMERSVVLVPVPTTARRVRVRGMDGVAILAQTVSAATGLTAIGALEQSAGDAQRGRGRAQRLAARERFRCIAPAVRGERILLIDDVCTTGATLRDCARALRGAGAIVDAAAVVALALHGGAGPYEDARGRERA